MKPRWMHKWVKHSGNWWMTLTKAKVPGYRFKGSACTKWDEILPNKWKWFAPFRVDKKSESSQSIRFSRYPLAKFGEAAVWRLSRPRNNTIRNSTSTSNSKANNGWRSVGNVHPPDPMVEKDPLHGWRRFTIRSSKFDLHHFYIIPVSLKIPGPEFLFISFRRIVKSLSFQSSRFFFAAPVPLRLAYNQLNFYVRLTSIYPGSCTRSRQSFYCISMRFPVPFDTL